MERKFLQIPQDTLFLIQNRRRLSKYSLWTILDLISRILICLCILTKMWSLLPSALIEPKVHLSRFKYLMHLFRGSSLHILCFLVLKSLARIHVCSSSVRCLNILSILFTWINFMARVLVVSNPHGKEVTNSSLWLYLSLSTLGLDCIYFWLLTIAWFKFLNLDIFNQGSAHVLSIHISMCALYIWKF
jgi:hypothetical protein